MQLFVISCTHQRVCVNPQGYYWLERFNILITNMERSLFIAYSGLLSRSLPILMRAPDNPAYVHHSYTIQCLEGQEAGTHIIADSG